MGHSGEVIDRVLEEMSDEKDEWTVVYALATLAAILAIGMLVL